MKELFNEVASLIERDSLNPADHLCKSAEEHGELAKEINRVIGRKKRGKYSDAEIRQNIVDELADNIQCLFGIARCINISYDEISESLSRKNQSYRENIENRELKTNNL